MFVCTDYICTHAEHTHTDSSDVDAAAGSTNVVDAESSLTPIDDVFVVGRVRKRIAATNSFTMLMET